MKLNMNTLMKSTSGKVTRKADETEEHYLSRVTHLHLENKSLVEIDSEIGLCKDLMVLYLYDNLLKEIPCLDSCQSLTQIYVQNNHITRMKGFSWLPNLTKLYIGHNNITVVEDLHNNSVLQELQINNQTFPPGEQLLFDPRSLLSISSSLTVLNINGNNIDSLLPLSVLTTLVLLHANDNCINDFNETTATLSRLVHLTRLELLQNPICTMKKYRDRIIIAAVALESLDGKDVSETSRKFLVNWKANKEAVDKKKNESLSKGAPVYLTANEMRFSSAHPQQHPQRGTKYSGKEIMRVTIS